MSQNHQGDLLDHMLTAAEQIGIYVSGMDRDGFQKDLKTQQAVIFNLLVIGEAASRLLCDHEGFTARFPQLPWKSMRGMRNRLAHGYFDINLNIV